MTPALPMLLALCALLVGCVAGKVAPTPASALQIPALWRNDIGPASRGASIERGWWLAFDDPALSALVTEAIERSGDLRIARTHVTELQARSVIADSTSLPTLTAEAHPARTRILNPFGQPYVTNVLQVGVQASYEFDLWGKLGAASDSAMASLQAERASTDAVALSIAASVASAYLNMRGLDAQLELAEATLVLRVQSRELARKNFEAGYSTRLEVLQAQAEYGVTAELVPQLQRAIGEQENALSLLAGRTPGPVQRGRPLAALPIPLVPAGLPSDLLRRRPDIYRAEQNLLAQHANLEAVRDQLLPSFKLNAGATVQNLSFSKLLNAPTALWSLALGASGPLFDGGRLQAQTDIAAAQRDASVFAYENAVRQALAETENGLNALRRLDQQAAITVARRATAAEALRIARDRHSNGYSSYLEELDAQRGLYSADLAVLQIRTRALVASVDLYRALGGGWRADD